MWINFIFIGNNILEMVSNRFSKENKSTPCQERVLVLAQCFPALYPRGQITLRLYCFASSVYK